MTMDANTFRARVLVGALTAPRNLAGSGCFFARTKVRKRDRKLAGRIEREIERRNERNARSYRRNENSRIHESRDL